MTRGDGSHGGHARRGARLLAGALAATVALGVGGPGPVAVAAPVPRTTPGPWFDAAVAEAAVEFSVPESVLRATMRAGQGAPGRRGPMGLVGPDGPGADTLDEAALLLPDASPDEVAHDPVANVRGGAALLRSRQLTAGHEPGVFTDARTWTDAVAAVAQVDADEAARVLDRVVGDRARGRPLPDGALVPTRVDRRRLPVSTIVLRTTAGFAHAGPRVLGAHATAGPRGLTRHLDDAAVAWASGNAAVDARSLALAVEGNPASPSGYDEATYRRAAEWVREAVRRHHVPLDRFHVVGLDQVPAASPDRVPGQAATPGPFWDWEHFFDLLGAPLDEHLRPGTDAVRILPGEHHTEPVTGCAPTEPRRACAGIVHAVLLRTRPADAAPLIADRGRRPDLDAATTDVTDGGARVPAGVDLARVARRGDWTGVRVRGSVAWFKDPGERIGRPHAMPMATSEHGAEVVGCPLPSAPAPADVTGAAPPPQREALGHLPAGQPVPVVGLDAAADLGVDASGHTRVLEDGTRWVRVAWGTRFGWVRADDVTVTPRQDPGAGPR